MIASPCGQCCVSQPSCHIHICIWFLEYGGIWGNHGPSTFGNTLLTNADITDILRTAYLQTPQQLKALLFRIVSGEVWAGLTFNFATALAARSTCAAQKKERWIMRSAFRRFSVASGCVSKYQVGYRGIPWDRPKMDKNGQFFPGKPMISDPAMLFFAKPSLAD